MPASPRAPSGINQSKEILDRFSIFNRRADNAALLCTAPVRARPLGRIMEPIKVPQRRGIGLVEQHLQDVALSALRDSCSLS